MNKPKLRQLLNCFEEAPEGISLLALAHDLDLSVGQVESMTEYWIRKGRIRIAPQQPDCYSCSGGADCPFLLEMPRSYELIPEGESS